MCGRGISMHTPEETRHSSEFDRLGTHSGPAEFGTRFFGANAQKGKGKFRKPAFWVHSKKPVDDGMDCLCRFFKHQSLLAFANLECKASLRNSAKVSCLVLGLPVQV